MKSPSNMTAQLSAAMGARVAARRSALGMTQAELGQAVGMAQQSIVSIEKGDVARPKRLREIAAALGTTEVFLLTGNPADAPPSAPPPPQPREGYNPPPQFFDGHDLPVFAAVEGGPGEMVVNSDPVDYVVRPWFLRNIKDGYAVIVSGESMVPLFEPGDMVLVNPRLPVVPGKAAIFVEGEERGEFNATVKRFVKSEPDVWRARQFNPERELALPKSRWRKALRIVGKYDGY